jgi:polar amino acid transport system substrate-binding protein
MKQTLTFILFFISTTVFSSEYIDVVTEELKPLNYSENGEIKGTATSVVRKVLDKAGVAYKINVYPWARAYSRAESIENVMIYTMNRSPERELLFKWIGSVTPQNDSSSAYSTSLYKLKSNNDVVAETLLEAKKYSVAVVRKDTNYDFLSSQGFSKLNLISTRAQSIKMLLLNRVDLIIGSRLSLKEEFKLINEPFDKIEIVLPAREANLYMAMSKQTSEELVIKLKKAYRELFLSKKILNVTK